MPFAGFQEKLRQKYIEQNTARMNIKQQKESWQEIEADMRRSTEIRQSQTPRSCVQQDHDGLPRNWRIQAG